MLTDSDVARAFSELADILADRHSLDVSYYPADDNGLLDDLDDLEYEDLDDPVGDLLPIMAPDNVRLPRALAYCDRVLADD